MLLTAYRDLATCLRRSLSCHLSLLPDLLYIPTGYCYLPPYALYVRWSIASIVSIGRVGIRDIDKYRVVGSIELEISRARGG